MRTTRICRVGSWSSKSFPGGYRSRWLAAGLAQRRVTVFGGAVLGELQSEPATRVHGGAARSRAFSVVLIKVAHGERCGSAVVQDWLWRTRRKEQCRAINGVLGPGYALLYMYCNYHLYLPSAIVYSLRTIPPQKNVIIGKMLIRHPSRPCMCGAAKTCRCEESSKEGCGCMWPAPRGLSRRSA